MRKIISTEFHRVSRFQQYTVSQQFENLFGLVPPVIWPEATQQQDLHLLHRIQNTTNFYGLPTGMPEIAFGINKNLERCITKTRVALTQKVQNSLMTTFEKMKTKPYTLSAENRPGFIARTSNFEKLALTEDTIHDRQDSTRVSPKYPKQVVVYDISKRTYIQDDFTAIDHADPWSLIAARVNSFLDYVNGASSPIKDKFLIELLKHHPGYFVLTGSRNDNVGATEFLAPTFKQQVQQHRLRLEIKS